MSGLSRTPGKRVWVNSPPRVRIPPAPPEPLQKSAFGRFFVLNLPTGIKKPPEGGFFSDARGSAHDGDLFALATFVGVERQSSVFDVAFLVESDRARHAFEIGLTQCRQVFGRIG